MNQFKGRFVPFLKFIGLILLSASLARAQGSMQVVKVSAKTETDAVHADSQAKVAVVAEITAGYHINDHTPTLDYLIPTKFEVSSTDQVSLKSAVYPKGRPKKFPFSDEPLSVYEGNVVIAAVLQVAKTATPGEYPLKAKFSYQACSEHACLPPRSVPVDLTLKIVPQNVPLKVVETNVSERSKSE
jgi:hypothetical protein